MCSPKFCSSLSDGSARLSQRSQASAGAVSEHGVANFKKQTTPDGNPRQALNSASGFRQLTELPFCSNSQLQFSLERAPLGVCCVTEVGTRVGATTRCSTDAQRLCSELRQILAGSLGLKLLPPKGVGKRRSQTRSFVC